MLPPNGDALLFPPNGDGLLLPPKGEALLLLLRKGDVAFVVGAALLKGEAFEVVPDIPVLLKGEAPAVWVPKPDDRGGLPLKADAEGLTKGLEELFWPRLDVCPKAEMVAGWFVCGGENAFCPKFGVLL